MKNQETVPLTVKILGREYQVSCPMDERDHLLASARYLDDRMQAIRKRAAGLGVERIAVMTALNMAREMLDKDTPSSPPSKVTPISAEHVSDEDERAYQMQLRIDAELEADGPIDLS